MDELNAALKLTKQQPESAVLAPIVYATEADIFLKRSGRKLLLTGNTKRVQNIIREFSGAWNFRRKAWEFGDWQKNALEAKLRIKAWEDSSEQMALRDAEEDFLQEWIEEEGVSLRENGENETKNNTMDIWQQFGIITDASTIDASEQIENIPADILHAIEQTLLAEAKALQRRKIRKSVALVRYEDFFEFEKPLTFGEYFFENDDRQAMIALNDTFIASEDLLTAVFWHEYAHHIYHEWRLELNIKMEKLMEIAVRQTQTWTKLETLNKRENSTYWTEKEEVWARAASQLFMHLASENAAL